MTLAESIDLLELEPVAPGRYQVRMPAGSPEGGTVVFGGQLMAQMIMAACAGGEAHDLQQDSMVKPGGRGPSTPL
jgi:acyl-CoA thioesterase